VSCLMVLNKLLEMQEVGTETNVSSELIHTIIAQVKQWRGDSDEIFLLDTDAVPTTNAAWPVVTFNVELATFMSDVVSKSSSVLSSDEWDFLLCSLVAWFQTVQAASLSLLHSPCFMCLITVVSRLLHRITVCVQNVVPPQLDAYPSSLISEWQDVFSISAFEMAVPLFVSLASAALSASSLMVSAVIFHFHLQYLSIIYVSVLVTV